MANRSHVYLTDQLPTKAKHKRGQFRGVCEWNWEIPISHLLLVANKPKRVQSAIWKDHEIGIAADSKGAVERLLAFIDLLGQGEVKSAGYWDDCVDETKKFFASKKRKGKWFLLEAGELFDMSGNDLVKECDAVVKAIPAMVKKVDKALAGGEKPWVSKLRKNWEKELGLYWSDVLYYSP
jgi:hypothetical protein